MGNILAVLSGGAAVAALTLSIDRMSLSFGLIGVVCAVGTVLLVRFAPRKGALSSAAATADAPSAREATAAEPPAKDAIGTHCASPRIFAPASMDVAGVAEALLSSARNIGSASHVQVWRALPDTGEPLLIAEAGIRLSTESLAHEGVEATIAAGTTALIRLGHSDDSESIGWRYLIPVTATGVLGVAAVDFEAEPLDSEGLIAIASAFRLPLAAGIFLELSQQESKIARALLQSAHDLTRDLSPSSVASATLKRAMDLSRATSGSVMLYGESGSTLHIVASVGISADVVRDTAVRPGDGIAGWVALSGQPLIIEDLPSRRSSANQRDVRCAASLPIRTEDGILGVLNVGSEEYPCAFTPLDLESLETLAGQAATALRNAQAIASSDDAYLGTLRSLALALETTEPYALGGSERVLDYTSRLGAAFGLSREDAQALETAAILHDIGMSAVGEATLISERPLSTVERALLKMHPVIAAEIVKQSPALRDVTPIIYHHHERYDGSGYVDGLSGEDIPTGSRILTVADAFVAMTSERPYRPALTENEALAQLREHAGTQFDPAVVDTFVAIFADTPDRIRAYDC